MDIKYIENNLIGIERFWEKINETVLKDSFANIKEPKSPTFLLTGNWGIGKTHFVDTVITKYEEKKWLYIDLLEESFGNDYFREILEKIANTFIPDSDIEKIKEKISSFIKKGFKTIVYNKLGIEFDENIISNNDFIDEINGLIDDDDENLYIFLDNLERIHKDEQIDFIKILSLLSKIKNLKIVLITHKNMETSNDAIGMEYIDKFITGCRFELIQTIEDILGEEISNETAIPLLIRNEAIKFHSGNLATARTLLREGKSDVTSGPALLRDIYAYTTHEKFFNEIWNSLMNLIESRYIEYIDMIFDDYSELNIRYILSFSTGMSRRAEHVKGFIEDNFEIFSDSFHTFRTTIEKVFWTFSNANQLYEMNSWGIDRIPTFKEFVFELSKKYWINSK